MNIPNLDCPNCQEGMVFENKGQLFCEDCHTALRVIPMLNASGASLEILDEREKTLLIMALAMKIQWFSNMKPKERKYFGEDKVTEVIEEFRTLSEKLSKSPKA